MACDETVLDCGSTQTADDSSSETPEEPMPAPKTKSSEPSQEKSTKTMPAAPVAVPETKSEEQSSTQDLFPGPREPQATPAPEKQQGTEIDELFEEPSAVTEPQPSPSSTPSATPSNSTEALFVEPQQAEEQAPATAPPGESESSPAEPPAEETTTEQEESSDSFEELFGPAENESESTDEETQAPFDPFGQFEPAAPELFAKQGALPTEPRRWVDSTERFTCHAALVGLTSESVILETSEKIRLTVIFSRLSDADLVYVRDQIQLRRELLASSALPDQFAVSWTK